MTHDRANICLGLSYSIEWGKKWLVVVVEILIMFVLE